ncbi:MAG: NfeD family protein [Symplocastrum torsivum CPER-KK1]|jgi:membrane protein implicated in regulation of membrane protease activity|uniref:NfeD family protein n=1 Tax=Symplocastrum torsivum CPER-KK1 TaxID=450513 RepID=A0A951UDG7_9CYAN|nr:NfeD family protein [Symplocastrum torsivum CPER-KK1]
MPLLSPAMLWLLAGSILCLLELFVPTAFVAFLMGLSAFVVALVALMLPTVLSVQVLLWLLLSTSLVVLSRRFLPHPTASKNLDAMEAQTLTEIPPGHTGRVLYEGNSWQARCEDEEMAIAPNQKVYVVRRQGTTLIVLPQSLLQ